MQLIVFKDHHDLSQQAAEEIIELVKRKPGAVLCLASGSTPLLTCELLVQKARAENIDLSSCTFIGLDEWVGIPPENEGSCAYFFHNQVFKHLNFSSSHIYLFNALSDSPQQECKEMDNVIFENGGIDLMLVGVGMNGHIGFNEPGISFDLYAHVAELDETTTSVGQKYFKEATELHQGITLGLKHLLESKKVLLLANGSKKAAVIQKALEGEITNRLPASIIRRHPNSTVMIDEEAAAMLKR
ncbi:glucosamine-6-phosphate deaminase [Agriterribacter sp.]|uniref:6-phosphogluconolactonase n=1 Tax=Agriterribacter sp. TaxID=2821509 RepID=UPI002C9D7052|nr:glucosamine-6-phosphate deaminase [Agriterribacter sp.]HRP55097.1 glucosamine-6-phosphate deaminase [Agriterribacter sp.]